MHIPARYVVTFILFLGYTITSMMKVSLSVSLVAMVNQSMVQQRNFAKGDSSCPEIEASWQNESHANEYKVPNREGSFNWDIQTQATILGAFFYGFGPTILIGSILLQKVRVKWLLGMSILITSIQTLLTPLAAQYDVTAVIVMRVIEGVLQCVAPSAKNVFISGWAPIMERSRHVAIINSGMSVGMALGMLFSGMLANSNILGGWPSVFYVFGSLGCIWVVLYCVFVYETPADHPWISESELKYIKENVNHSSRKMKDVPWKAILTSVPMWALVVCITGGFWDFCTITAELPSFLGNVLHFDLETNGMLSGLPYIAQVSVGYFGAYIADKMRQSGKFSISVIRKLMNSIAAFGAGICFLGVAFINCNRTLNVSLLILARTISGFKFSGATATTVDICPDYTAIVAGIAYTFGNLCGILGPYVVGQLTKTAQTFENWRWIFIIISGVHAFTATIFIVFGSAEVQPWGLQSQGELSGQKNRGFYSEEQNPKSNEQSIQTKL